MEIALWHCDSTRANPTVLVWDATAAYMVGLLEMCNKGANNNAGNNDCDADDDTRGYTMYSVLRERAST